MVHDTIQWLNCAMHFLNMKVNKKIVEKSNAQFWSALKWDPVYKIGRLGLEQVYRL